MAEFNPVQILHTGLIIVDSNGVQRGDTLYEIEKVLNELTNGYLLYISVYDNIPVEEGFVVPIRTEKRFYNAADFLAIYGNKIRYTFIEQSYAPCFSTAITSEQICTEIVPQVTEQVDIIPVEKNIIQNIPYSTPSTLNQIYAPATQLLTFNQAPIVPAEPKNVCTI